MSATIWMRDTREGIQLTRVVVGGNQLPIDAGGLIPANLLVALARTEGVYLKSEGEDT